MDPSNTPPWGVTRFAEAVEEADADAAAADFVMVFVTSDKMVDMIVMFVTSVACAGRVWNVHR